MKIASESNSAVLETHLGTMLGQGSRFSVGDKELAGGEEERNNLSDLFAFAQPASIIITAPRKCGVPCLPRPSLSIGKMIKPGMENVSPRRMDAIMARPIAFADSDRNVLRREFERRRMNYYKYTVLSFQKDKIVSRVLLFSFFSFFFFFFFQASYVIVTTFFILDLILIKKIILESNK